MPDRPVEDATAEGQRIRVTVVTRGVEHPWSIAFPGDPGCPAGPGRAALVLVDDADGAIPRIEPAF